MESYITEYLKLQRMVQLPKETEATDKLINKLIEDHEKNLDRYKVLQGYYEGYAKIFEREKDEYKSNNKLKLDYASYIVDVFLGLFVGNPITYTVSEEYQGIMEQLQEVFDLNDEQDENTELAKMASIKGRGYEIVYLDEESNICFNEVKPENIILVYDDSIKPAPLFAIYFIKKKIEDKEVIDITLYTKEAIKHYTSDGGKLTQTDEETNFFQEIPVVEFLNNDEGIGDFERVIPLIDAINKAQSDTANDFEEFTDSILVLSGMPQADEEDLQMIKEDKILLLDRKDGGQAAEWLVKQINDQATESYKNRLDRDIHKFAKVPNISDEAFASNISGESMKYKLFTTDQVIVAKQRKFKSAIQRRIDLILKVLNLKGSTGDFTYRDVSIVFNDNKPYNELDNITTVKACLDAGLSKTYSYGKLRDIDDIQEEIARQEQEKDAYAESFNKEVEDGQGIPGPTEKVRETSKE